MPAETVPQVQDFLDAAEGGIGGKNAEADLHDGSGYDVWRGVAAVAFARAAKRAQGNFRNVYLDTATGEALDTKVAEQYSSVTPRYAATKGTGSVRLIRPTTGAGSGSILQGTRIAVSIGGGVPQYYTVASNASVSGSALWVDVNIEALREGSGTSIQAHRTDQNARLWIEDAVFDSTFYVESIACNAGIDEESPAAFKARVRDEREANRPGYESSIVAVMQAAGAVEVRLFASDYLGEETDLGLNYICVSDASFTTTAALLEACRRAVFDCVMAGTGAQVLPIQRGRLTVKATIKLWSPVQASALDGLREDAQRRASEYVEQNPFVWRLQGIGGAVRGDSTDVEDVSVTSVETEPNPATLFAGGVLTRWVLRPDDCVVVFE